MEQCSTKYAIWRNSHLFLITANIWDLFKMENNSYRRATTISNICINNTDNDNDDDDDDDDDNNNNDNNDDNDDGKDNYDYDDNDGDGDDDDDERKCKDYVYGKC